MKIAFIISTYNRVKLLEKILDQIQELAIPIGVEVKSIVINDGSTDKTNEILLLRKNEVITINSPGNWWWTKCMNEGFKLAEKTGFNYVIILNDDIEIKKDYLTILLSDYNQLPINSILGSASVSLEQPHRIESAGTKDFIKWRFKFVPYFKNFKIVDNSFSGIKKTWTLSGRGTMIPVSIFKSIGYYDESLVQYGSDDEFCLRANLNNIQVYISWNALIYNHTLITSQGTVFKKEGITVVLKSFFNKYSVNSLAKNLYLYRKYSYSLLIPLYIFFLLLGTIKAYYFNYNDKV